VVHKQAVLGRVVGSGINDAGAQVSKYAEPRQSGAMRLRTTPLRWLLVADAVLAIVAAVGAVALATGGSGHSVVLGHVTVGDFKGKRAVYITDGTVTANSLVQGLTRLSGARDATTIKGRPFLKTDVVVGSRGILKLGAGQVFLLSTAAATVDLRVEGGSLELAGTELSSRSPLTGGPDLDNNDGRSEVVAEGSNSHLSVVDSKISALGSSAETPGLSWRAGASGGVSNSIVTGNFRGIYGYQSGPLSITKTTVRGSTEAGIVLRSLASDSRLSDSTVSNNAAAGVQIVDLIANTTLTRMVVNNNGTDGISVTGSRTVAIQGGTLHDNKSNGLTVTDTIALDARQVIAWGNSTGFALNNVHAELRNNILSGNAQDGLLVDDSASGVRIAGDRYDHNGRAGFWVADGAVALTRVTFDRNQTGLRMADNSPAIVVTASTFINNVKDGMALDGLKGVEVTGCTFTGNRSAAFSTAAKGDLSALLRSNTIGKKKQMPQRVRQNVAGAS